MNSLMGPGREKGALVKFVQGYARLLTVMRPLVVDHNGYDRSLPFWSNVVLLLQSLLSETPRESRRRPRRPESTWLQSAQNQITKLASGVQKLASRVSNPKDPLTVDQVINDARKLKATRESSAKKSTESASESRPTRMIAEPGDFVSDKRESDELAGEFAKMGLDKTESTVNPVWKWIQNVRGTKIEK